MKILELTDTEIEKIVATDLEMLKNGSFPDLRLENDGPDWGNESFVNTRRANLQWWLENGPTVAE